MEIYRKRKRFFFVIIIIGAAIDGALSRLGARNEGAQLFHNGGAR
jgi:hypothetical protein